MGGGKHEASTAIGQISLYMQAFLIQWDKNPLHPIPCFLSKAGGAREAFNVGSSGAGREDILDKPAVSGNRTALTLPIKFKRCL